MIVYRLVCKNGHEFEGWFADGAAFDVQAEKGRVLCPTCNSRKIEKAIMAPAVARKGAKALRSETGAGPLTARETGAAGHDPKLTQLLSELRTHVEKNYDYVGEKFPEEARKIHYGETDQRHIYGEATLKEVKELTEEGVAVAPLPLIPRRDS